MGAVHHQDTKTPSGRSSAWCLGVLVVFFLASCGGGNHHGAVPTTTATATSSSTATPTATASSTPTVTPSPSATPTATENALRLPALHAEPDAVDGGRIVDGEGRQVLLRGVNVNALVDYWKGSDFATVFPFGSDDADLMAAIGWNA